MPRLSQLSSRLTAIGLCMALTSPLALGRLWTDSTGAFKVEAELVTVRNGKAYLENEEGQIKKVPLDRLSKGDLQHLASLPNYKEQLAPFLPQYSEDKNDDSKPQRTRTTKVKLATIRSKAESGTIRHVKSPSWGYNDLAFSRDGGQVFMLGNDNIAVFDLNKSETTTIKNESRMPFHSCVSVSPDGRKLLVGNDDGEILVWKCRGKQVTPESRFAIFDGSVTSVTLSPDGRVGLSTHYDDRAFLWNTATGEILASFRDLDFGDRGAAIFSKQGGHILFSDGELVALAESKNQQLAQVMQLGEHTSPQAVAISPGGLRVAVSDSRELHVWETQTGKQLPALKDEDLQWSVEFSPGGNRLISGGSGVVSLWDLETGQLVKKFDMLDSGYVQHVAFSPDGIHFAAIGGPIGQLVQVFRAPPEFVDP